MELIRGYKNVFENFRIEKEISKIDWENSMMYVEGGKRSGLERGVIYVLENIVFDVLGSGVMYDLWNGLIYDLGSGEIYFFGGGV